MATTECPGCDVRSALISPPHDRLCQYNPMRPESASDVIEVNTVARFLVRCDCGWEQLHRDPADAEWDGRRHAYEWHAIGNPALIGPPSNDRPGGTDDA